MMATKEKLLVLILLSTLVGECLSSAKRDETPRECYEEDNAADYRGTWDRAMNGETCLYWAQTEYKDNEALIDAKNYCRNPDGSTKAWCVTKSGRVNCHLCSCEKFDDDACGDTNPCEHGMTCVPKCTGGYFCQCPDGYYGDQCQHCGYVKTSNGRTCHFPFTFYHDHQECYPYGSSSFCANTYYYWSNYWYGWCTGGVDDLHCPTAQNCKRTHAGTEYRNTTSVTRRGYTCQAWNSDEPNQNEYPEDYFYPDGSKDAASNYCRNPNNAKEVPWCYIDDDRTTDSWDYCDICLCEDKDETTKECYTQNKAEDYTGTLDVSYTGAACLPWSSQDVDFPGFCLEDAQNYCRNPDGSDTAWCFTENGREDCEVCHCDEYEYDACEKYNPCQSGATCRPKCGGGYMCSCPTGYYGNRCQYCGSVITTNGGTCYFPFVFYGDTYSCYDYGPWSFCSLTYNYFRDGQWGICDRVENADHCVLSTDWSREILQDISNVPGLGEFGSLIVWGDHAEIILTRPFYSGYSLIGAAENEAGGRMIVFTSTRYTEEFLSNSNEGMMKLIENIKKWLLKDSGADAVVQDVSEATDFSADDNTNVVVWDGSEKSDSFVSDLESWLTTGNGLVVAADVNSVQAGTHTSVNGVLLKAGLSFMGLKWSKDSDISVYANRNDETHFGKLIDKAIESEVNIGSTYYSISSSMNNEHFPQEALPYLKTKFEKLFDFYNGTLHYIPTQQNPVSGYGRDLCRMYVTTMLDTFLEEKAPALDNWPGDFESPPPLVKVDMEISSYQYDWFGTGYYLPAGQEAIFRITERTGDDPDGWTVLVNAHTDDNTWPKDTWIRWPYIARKFAIGDKDEVKIRSPFGGLIILLSPGTGTNSIKFTMDNVVETPRFDMTDPDSLDQWAARKNAPGLYALFEGEFITIVQDSADVRNIDDPKSSLKVWDDVVASDRFLMGHNPRDYRREWIVHDIQISYGWGHAGYPIMTGWQVRNLLNFTNEDIGGDWGNLHEIGHNMQGSKWTLKGQIDVTTNVFAIWNQDEFANIDPWIAGFGENRFGQGSIDNAKNMLNSLGTGFSFDKYVSDLTVALMIYGQMAHHFGWPHMQKVLRAYIDLPAPATDQDEIDEWVIQCSKAAERDLRPCFEFWGWGLTDRVEEEVSSYTPYFWQDDCTDTWSDSRTQFILDRYPDVSREIEKSTEVFDDTIPDPVLEVPLVRASNQENM